MSTGVALMVFRIFALLKYLECLKVFNYYKNELITFYINKKVDQGY